MYSEQATKFEEISLLFLAQLHKHSAKKHSAEKHTAHKHSAEKHAAKKQLI